MINELIFKYVGTCLAIILSVLAAGHAISTVGCALSGAVTEKPEVGTKLLIPVVLAEAIAVYGMLISFMIITHTGGESPEFAYKAFYAGIITGITGLISGLAIASTGSAMAGAVAQRPEVSAKLLLPIVLAEALAVYGMLISFMMIT